MDYTDGNGVIIDVINLVVKFSRCFGYSNTKIIIDFHIIWAAVYSKYSRRICGSTIYLTAVTNTRQVEKTKH